MPAYWSPVFLSALLASALAPYEYLVWFLEVLPPVAAYLALLATRRWWTFTPLSYAVLLALCLIILVGAHYSFGRVPLFEWLKPWLGGTRNQFDKFAHFFQGFAPALLFREVLVRCGVVVRRAWLYGLVPALCLALSAAYELVEWMTALLLEERSQNFLAIQGDMWDAQSDMAFALMGSMVAVGVLSRAHDRQLAKSALRGGKPFP